MINNVQPILDRFRGAAPNFIPTVDSIYTIERDVFLALLSHRLAELYSSALDLPAVEPDTTDIDHTPFPADKGEELWHALKRKFEPLDSYWVILTQQKRLLRCRRL